jgi:hypothetical protein
METQSTSARLSLESCYLRRILKKPFQSQWYNVFGRHAFWAPVSLPPIHIHVHICIYVRIQVHVCIRIRIHIHVCVHGHFYIRIDVYVCLYDPIHIPIPIRIRVCIRIHIQIKVHIRMKARENVEPSRPIKNNARGD